MPPTLCCDLYSRITRLLTENDSPLFKKRYLLDTQTKNLPLQLAHDRVKLGIANVKDQNGGRSDYLTWEKQVTYRNSLGKRRERDRKFAQINLEVDMC